MQTKLACPRCRTSLKTDSTVPPGPASHRRAGKRRAFVSTCLVGVALLLLGTAPAPSPAAGDDGPPPLRIPPKKKGVGRFGSLTAAEQKRVNEAIDKGVAFLRKEQLPSGSWAKKGQPHQVGYAALAGLTLLECGLTPEDPTVKKAYRAVKFNSTNLDKTYEISLAILFLDRLGSSKDRKLIQTLALRLVAGQNSAGGWTYHCPLLKVPEEKLLLTYLRQRQPQYVSEAIADTNPDPKKKQSGEAVTDPKQKKSGKLPEAVTDPNPGQSPGTKKDDPKFVDPAGTPPKGEPKKGDPKVKGKKLKVPPKVERLRPEFLPPKLRDLPVVQKGKRSKIKGKLVPATDDNSNTQFAILGLWAARRHYVPMEMTLALVEERFRSSQCEGGGWGYPYNKGGQTGPMTCVGLIGLAVGHGAMMPIGAKVEDAPPAKDEAITRGLKALGGYIGQPGQKNPAMGNAYFMWSLERVGVLYNLRTIGGKDWYKWGVEVLLANQQGNGSWNSAPYHGHSPPLDTCMALLFLKRANLTRDLTENLRLRLAITDPDAGP
jgi:hypothetical protein